MRKVAKLFLGICPLCLVMFYVAVSLEYNFSFEWNTEKFDRYNSPGDFEGFDNVSGSGDGCYIVPNIIHFIRFDQGSFSFVDTICVLAAHKNQKPDKILFHTNLREFEGKYWNILLSVPELKRSMELRFMRIPEQVFGRPLSRNWRRFHGGDVARLMVLMKYGGIFLDNDSYIVKSLNQFRRFEIALGWKEGGNISNQVIVANKNARFLREWLLTYRYYNPKSWFYNAAIRPTQVVLLKHPDLVHRVSRRLAEYHGIAKMLYLSKSDVWRDHYAIHLFINHQRTLIRSNLTEIATYPVVFNENNIVHYNTNFRDMVYDVFPFHNWTSSES